MRGSGSAGGDGGGAGEDAQNSAKSQAESGPERALALCILELELAFGVLGENGGRIDRQVSFAVKFTQRLGACMDLVFGVENDCNMLFFGFSFPCWYCLRSIDLLDNVIDKTVVT